MGWLIECTRWTLQCSRAGQGSKRRTWCPLAGLAQGHPTICTCLCKESAMPTKSRMRGTWMVIHLLLSCLDPPSNHLHAFTILMASYRIYPWIATQIGCQPPSSGLSESFARWTCLTGRMLAQSQFPQNWAFYSCRSSRWTVFSLQASVPQLICTVVMLWMPSHTLESPCMAWHLPCNGRCREWCLGLELKEPPKCWQRELRWWSQSAHSTTIPLRWGLIVSIRAQLSSDLK